MKFGKIENIVNVVADGGIGHPEINDGNLIPVVIVDCQNHTELIDLCLLHENVPPGDVETKWIWNVLNRRNVYLRVEFSSPVKTSASIRFDVRKQGGVVSGIIIAHAFYLQPSAFGSRASEGLGQPNILIEVPSAVTPPDWYAVFEKQLTKRYRDEGYDKTQAKQAAREYIKRAKETWLLRVPQGKQKPVAEKPDSKTS